MQDRADGCRADKHSAKQTVMKQERVDHQGAEQRCLAGDGLSPRVASQHAAFTVLFVSQSSFFALNKDLCFVSAHPKLEIFVGVELASTDIY